MFWTLLPFGLVGILILGLLLAGAASESKPALPKAKRRMLGGKKQRISP